MLLASTHPTLSHCFIAGPTDISGIADLNGTPELNRAAECIRPSVQSFFGMLIMAFRP